MPARSRDTAHRATSPTAQRRSARGAARWTNARRAGADVIAGAVVGAVVGAARRIPNSFNEAV